MSSKLVLRRRTRRRSHLNLDRVHCSMSRAQHCSTAALTPGHESAVVIMPHCSCPSCIVNIVNIVNIVSLGKVGHFISSLCVRNCICPVKVRPADL